MFQGLRNRRQNRRIVDELYAGIVGQSREAPLYAHHGLPDTVMGRFESLSIHVFLFLARCRDDAELKPLAQDLVDRFMADVEDSIREIGIGDVAVPKRMRKLAGMFYERVDAYDGALADRDRSRLAAGLLRHALPADAGESEAAGLADHMFATKAEWDATPTLTLLQGHFGAQRGDHV